MTEPPPKTLATRTPKVPLPRPGSGWEGKTLSQSSPALAVKSLANHGILVPSVSTLSPPSMTRTDAVMRVRNDSNELYYYTWSLTALVLAQTICHNQSRDTTTNNYIIILLCCCRTKDGRQEDAEELNGHSQTGEYGHIETQSERLTRVNWGVVGEKVQRAAAKSLYDRIVCSHWSIWPIPTW